MRKSQLRKIIREIIIEDVKLPSGKWVKASKEGLKQFRQELYDIIKQSYAYIGGHHDFTSPNDINTNDANYWEYVDVDNDAEPDAVSAAKTTPYGKKTVMGATKGTMSAKAALIRHRINTIHKPGVYAEVSERIADILLNAGAPVVNDEKEVRTVLNKDIHWIGKIPGKKGDGWYTRSLGGSTHTKIMVGRPKY